MAESRNKDETVRIVDNSKSFAAKEERGLQDLERRVNSLQNDVSQLAFLASGTQRPGYEPAMVRLGALPFGALGQFPIVSPPGAGAALGNIAMGGQVPLFGGPTYPVPGADTVSAREFNSLASVTRQPGVNIVDVGEEFVVQVELPGAKKKDLELLGSERTITLTARVRTEPPDDVDGTVLLAECAPTVYRRTIQLPNLCNTSSTKASLKDGWLTLNVPKKDASSAIRRIDVAYG